MELVHKIECNENHHLAVKRYQLFQNPIDNKMVVSLMLETNLEEKYICRQVPRVQLLRF